MGTGFVLLVWSVPIIVLGLAVATMRVAGLIVRRRGRDAAVDRLTLLKAILMPPVAMITIGVACFAVYAAWCSGIRGVDWGIGDDFVVPLGHHYSMVMIDTPEIASIYKNATDGEPLIGGIREVSLDGDRVTGVLSNGGAFVLDTASDAITRYDSKDALLSHVTPGSPMQSAAATYYQRRWNWTDVIFVSLVIAIEAWIAWLSLQRARATVLTPTPAPPR